MIATNFQKAARTNEGRSGMIWVTAEVSKEKGLPAWLVISSPRLDCDEHGIYLRQHLGVVEFQDPAFL